MNNFTKEYIKECECKEIQGLIPNLKEFDFYIETDTKSKMIQNMSADKWSKIGMVWLPTGDQLDGEIVKICKANDWLYEIGFIRRWQVEVGNDTKFIVKGINANPLIAKIKLLKELLK